MANYSVEMNRTASATLGVGNVRADATRPRRNKWYDIMMGSEATPGDFAFLWRAIRISTAPTESAVTPAPLDPADAATESDAGENHTVDPTTGTVLLSIPLNQRATMRWVAAPGSELVSPATANNGIQLQTPTAGALVAVSATVLFQEQ